MSLFKNMSDLNIEVGSETWWEAVGEDIKDLPRSYPRKEDTPEVKKARAYISGRQIQ